MFELYFHSCKLIFFGTLYKMCRPSWFYFFFCGVASGGKAMPLMLVTSICDRQCDFWMTVRRALKSFSLFSLDLPFWDITHFETKPYGMCLLTCRTKNRRQKLSKVERCWARLKASMCMKHPDSWNRFFPMQIGLLCHSGLLGGQETWSVHRLR